MHFLVKSIFAFLFVSWHKLFLTSIGGLKNRVFNVVFELIPLSKAQTILILFYLDQAWNFCVQRGELTTCAKFFSACVGVSFRVVPLISNRTVFFRPQMLIRNSDTLWRNCWLFRTSRNAKWFRAICKNDVQGTEKSIHGKMTKTVVDWVSLATEFCRNLRNGTACPLLQVLETAQLKTWQQSMDFGFKM